MTIRTRVIDQPLRARSIAAAGLATSPGVGQTTADVIIAETGADITSTPSRWSRGDRTTRAQLTEPITQLETPPGLWHPHQGK